MFEGTFTIQQRGSLLYLDCAKDSNQLHLSDPHGGDNPYQRWTIKQHGEFENKPLYSVTQVAKVDGNQRPWTSSEGLDSYVQVIKDRGPCWHIEQEDGYAVFIRAGKGNYMDCKPEVGKRPYLAQHNVGNPYQQWMLSRV
jgi:hypothetical protein